jgi:ribonucleotide monophosphatase NagD (HAD superfamily)
MIPTKLMDTPTPTDIDALFENYDTFFLDAYGVLVDKRGALPGAVELIDRLNRLAKPYLVLTNSASRLPETMARDFHARGLDIDRERILSSGLLLQSYFEQKGLLGKTCVVLGPEDSIRYAEQAGADVVALTDESDAEMVVIGDQKGLRLHRRHGPHPRHDPAPYRQRPVGRADSL